MGCDVFLFGILFGSRPMYKQEKYFEKQSWFSDRSPLILAALFPLFWRVLNYFGSPDVDCNGHGVLGFTWMYIGLFGQKLLLIVSKLVNICRVFV